MYFKIIEIKGLLAVYAIEEFIESPSKLFWYSGHWKKSDCLKKAQPI